MNTVTPEIQASIDAMSAYFVSKNMGALDEEQIVCFNDPARRVESMGMLQDLRDRCGLPNDVTEFALAALVLRDGPVMPYMVEFDDFPTIMEKMPEGMTDTSWHNDMYPSFEYGPFRVWFEYPNKDHRSGPDATRYSVVVADNCGENGELLGTDSWDEVLYFMEAARGYTTEQLQFIGDRITQIKEQVTITVGTNFYAEGKILPDTISTFGELHDYCDANELGGLCDDEITENANVLFPERTDPDTISTQEWMEACEVIQCTVNVWLSSMPFVPLENDAPIVAEDQAPEAADTLNIIEGVFDGGGIERVDGMTTAMQARQA